MPAEEMPDVIDGFVGVVGHVRVGVCQRGDDERFYNSAVQPAEPTGKVREAEDSVAAYVEMRVAGQAYAETLRPLEVLSVEGHGDGHVEQLRGIVARDRGFGCFRAVELDRLVSQPHRDAC